MAKLDPVKIFLASPGDLAEERNLFPGVLRLLNDVVGRRLNHRLEPLGWEDALPNWGRPQALINQDVRQCEVFIMLLWKRWGMPSGQYSSGTEEEFEIAYERYRKTGSPHLLLYFRSVPQDMMADPGEQLQRVINFRTRIETERIGLFKTYDTPDQWRDHLMKHISEWLFTRVDGKTHADAADEGNVRVLTESKQEMLQLHRELEDSNEVNDQLETTKLRTEAINYAVQAMKFIEEGKFTLAEQNFAKSIDLYGEPEVLNNFGLFLYQTGSLDRARLMFETALSISDGEQGKLHQAIAYCSLGEVYQIRGDLNRAREMYEKALEINTTLGRQEGMAEAYSNLGDIYTIRGDLNKAERMHKDALQIDTRIGREKGVAKAYGRLGHVYRSKGDFNEAQEMYEKALEINTLIDYREGMAQDHLNLGNIYFLRKDLNRAQEMYERSLEINTKTGGKKGVADAYGSLGNMHLSKGDLDGAEGNYLKALEIDRLLGRTGGMANDYGNLGIIYEKRGSLDMAEKMHEKALELDVKIDRKEGIADDYDNLANLYVSKGEFERAEECWLEAIKIYATLGNISEMVRIQSMLNSHKKSS